MPDTETSVRERIDVQRAVQAAESFVRNMRSSLGDVSDVRLEEVEFSDDRAFWLITLSFMRPTQDSVLTSPPEREYRRFEIDATTGEFKSMTIRTI